MKNFSGVCQAAGADKPLRAFFIWITNIVTLSISCRIFDREQKRPQFPLNVIKALLKFILVLNWVIILPKNSGQFAPKTPITFCISRNVAYLYLRNKRLAT